MRLAAAAATTTTSYPLVNSDNNDCDKGQSPVLFLIFQKGKQIQTVIHSPAGGSRSALFQNGDYL
jgi:hypothetical protein